MTKKVRNQMGLAKNNRRIVLNFLRKEKITNRKKLAQLTGLDPSTITKIIKEFLNRGLCVETEPEFSGKVGRKTIGLKLSNEIYKSIVIRVGVQLTDIAIGYFDGSIRYIDTVRSDTNIKNFIDKLKGIISPIINDFDNEKFLGISVSLPGMVDTKNNYIIDVPHMGWRNISLKDYFESNVPLFIDNEANLSLIAEKWVNPLLKNVENIVFVYLSEGIGCGIMLGEQLYRGTFFNAGEFGHMIVDYNGKECHCGNRGCWETIASTEAIVREYERIYSKLEGSSFNDKFMNLVELSIKDKDAISLIRKEEENLSIGIANIVNSFSPEYVILGGWASILSDESIRRIEKMVNEKVLYTVKNKVKLIKSNLDQKMQGLAAITGAAYMIVDKSLDKIV